MEIKNESQTIVDDNQIEILVNYDYEQSEPQTEFGHGLHEVGCMVYTELKSVEVIICGVGIDILPSMNEKQKQSIISKLDYSK